MRTVTMAAIATAVSMAATSPASAQQKPAAAEATAILKAAGFVRKGAQWRSECGIDDPSGSYTPAAIEQYRDINGDGRMDAVVTEGGTFCYGNTGTGYTLLSKQVSGAWKVMDSRQGIAEFLKTKGIGGWPDISVGGPGFCFPVLRWNGKEYARNRFAYEGKPCRPNF